MTAIAEPPGVPLTQFTQDTSAKSKREAEEYADAALLRAKQSGLLLAVQARWIAMAVIAVMLPIVNPQWGVLYYHAYLVLFALIGWIQLKVGTAGQSRAELVLLFCDLVLMTLVTVAPSRFDNSDWPTAMQ